jgi:primosomal protein N' (replication factor Y) (superfamily II helicase)
MFSHVTSVLLPTSAMGVLSYLPTDPALPQGTLVRVPFGSRKLVGVIWKPDQHAKPIAAHKLRPIIEQLDLPPLSEELRNFVEWTANYYLMSRGAVLRMVLSSSDALEPPALRTIFKPVLSAPQGLSAKRIALWEKLAGQSGSAAQLAAYVGVSGATLKGLTTAGALSVETIATDTPFSNPVADYAKVYLSADQSAAAFQLCHAVAQKSAQPILLEGVTGSGKTEVYFEAIADVIRSGAQALVLLPEIAMTRQWFTRFAARFGTTPVEWHSGLTQAQRRRAWREIIFGRAQVIVGARSALFLPYSNLRLIVVDEEHETSFKQQEGVNYHARDMAVVRAKIENASIVLASATPSLETRHNAQVRKYVHLKLPSRFGGAQLPNIKVIDLKKNPPERRRWIAQPLFEDIKQTLDRGEQALLFLNRRGYAPVTICQKCGDRVTCPQCTAWMVEHRLSNKLHCHHCGFATNIPKNCFSCHATDSLVPCGPGVERIAEEIKAILPEAKTIIVTSDTINSREKAEKLISNVESGDINILIGTQLVTKGHHFPNLTCVGIIDADLGLSGGDLRAAERTFQQIVQASGRAGRAEKLGRVWLQTYQPETSLMQALAKMDFEGFYATETASRERAGVPPFGRYAALVISGTDKNQVEETARTIAQVAPNITGVAILGPAPAPLALLRGQHRVRLLLHASKTNNVQSILRRWLNNVTWRKSVRITIDVDPYSFL